MSLRLSKSSLGMYLHCPRSYYLGHIRHCTRHTDYPRLLGTCVHQFIAGFYRYHSGGRPFYFSDLSKARGAWFYAWKEALAEKASLIRFPNDKLASDCGVTGWICVQNYWKGNADKPPPLEVEKRFEYPVMCGVTFVGIFDQIRSASMESIQRLNAALVNGDNLVDGVAPVLVVDLKTNRSDFNLLRFTPLADKSEQAAFQFELHEDLQVTAYYWLYFQIFGRMPAGFIWYHLRSGKWFYTYRTKNDFPTFLEQLRFAVDGINAEEFPKHVSSSCKYCDYVEDCSSSDRPQMVTSPTEVESGEAQLSFGAVSSEPLFKQLRMKLSVPRPVRSKKV